MEQHRFASGQFFARPLLFFFYASMFLMSLMSKKQTLIPHVPEVDLNLYAPRGRPLSLTLLERWIPGRLRSFIWLLLKVLIPPQCVRSPDSLSLVMFPPAFSIHLKKSLQEPCTGKHILKASLWSSGAHSAL